MPARTRHSGSDAPPTHPRWPRAQTPRRIALLGWARLSLGAREGSGYNLSASELAAGLALAGHSVSYLRSGMKFSLRPGMRVRRTERWRGVECWELANAPNFSPAAANFSNMRAEISSPRQTRVILRWLDEVRAEVVHVHSLEGCPLDLIPAMAATGRPVVVTPHNYWFVCPQVDLLHREVALCTDYEGGARCEANGGCLPGGRIGLRRSKRRVFQSVERRLGSAPARWAHEWLMLARRLTGAGGREPGLDAHEFVLDPELADGFEGAERASARGGAGAHDGRIVHELGPAPRAPHDAPPVLPIDANERFLSSSVHLRVLPDRLYARRRAAGIASLNAASLVTPPSEFLGRAHASMGLDESRLRVVRLGQPHFDQIHRRAARSPGYRFRPWTPESPGPLRFAFLGVVRPNKGLEVLTRAIASLDTSVRRRSQFLIRAGGWDWPFRRRLAEFPEVQFAGGYDLIQLIAAGGEYDVGILPHVWFENSPLVLLEHLHAGKFVIASRLGGPPEWIVEPGASRSHPLGNGMMAPGGDAVALAGLISRLVLGEVEVPSPSEVHAVTPNLTSYPAHVAEVASVYESLLGGSEAGAIPVQAGEAGLS